MSRQLTRVTGLILALALGAVGLTGCGDMFVAALGRFPLRKGPDRSLDRFHPIFRAVKKKDTAQVRSMLARDPGLAKRRTPDQGSTILIFATRFSNLEIVRMLLDSGADPNRQNASGDTALHAAAEENTLPVVKLLVARGARLDIRNRAGRTPSEAAHERVRMNSSLNNRIHPIIMFLWGRERN